MPKNLNNIKEDILTVTRQLLRDTGYADLNIRKIAAQCGVATGTVYNYYSSKYEIIAEILLNEWKLMLRRLDQNTKEELQAIDKLEVVFNELNNFMNNVHGTWFETHPAGGSDQMSTVRIKEKMKLLRNQISEKVYHFIGTGKPGSTEAMDICDIISHILISYSNENAGFGSLKISLNALVLQLKELSK